MEKGINRLMNIFNLMASLAVFGTGLIMFFEFHVGDGGQHEIFIGIYKSVWVNIHRVMAIAFLTGFIIHLRLHWRCLTNIVRRWNIGLSNKIKTTFLQQLLLLTVSIVVLGTGFYAWTALSGRIYEESELRHCWIDVHNITGLMLLTGLTLHIKRRWRRFITDINRSS